MNDHNMRKVVELGYETGDYSLFYRTNRSLNQMERMLFDSLKFSNFSSRKVLDLGSGTGIPYDDYLISLGFLVDGIDISKKHMML